MLSEHNENDFYAWIIHWHGKELVKDFSEKFCTEERQWNNELLLGWVCRLLWFSHSACMYTWRVCMNICYVCACVSPASVCPISFGRPVYCGPA